MRGGERLMGGVLRHLRWAAQYVPQTCILQGLKFPCSSSLVSRRPLWRAVAFQYPLVHPNADMQELTWCNPAPVRLPFVSICASEAWSRLTDSLQTLSLIVAGIRQGKLWSRALEPQPLQATVSSGVRSQEREQGFDIGRHPAIMDWSMSVWAGGLVLGFNVVVLVVLGVVLVFGKKSPTIHYPCREVWTTLIMAWPVPGSVAPANRE